MGLIASRQDQDCEENRMLDFLTEYLNKIEYAGKGKPFKELHWYGKATNFGEQQIYDKKYYSAVLKKHTKQYSWTIEETDFIDIPLEVGDMFLRAFKIKELSRIIYEKE